MTKMAKKHIEELYKLFEDADETEWPVVYGYINDEEGSCRMALFANEEEAPLFALSLLLQIFNDMGDGATIEEFAESVKDEIIRFFWEQGTEA